MTRRNGPKPEPTDGLKVGDVCVRAGTSTIMAIWTITRLTKTKAIYTSEPRIGGKFTNQEINRARFYKSSESEIESALKSVSDYREAERSQAAAQAQREADPKYQLVRYMGGVENGFRGWDALTIEQLQQIKDWLLSVPPF